MSIASWITFKADSLDVTSYSLTILAHHFIKSLVDVNLPFLFKLNIASLLWNPAENNKKTSIIFEAIVFNMGN